MMMTWETLVAIATVLATLMVIISFIIKRGKDMAILEGRVTALEKVFNQIQQLQDSLHKIELSIITMTSSLGKVEGRVTALEKVSDQMQLFQSSLHQIEKSILMMTSSLEKLSEIFKIMETHSSCLQDLTKRVDKIEYKMGNE